jgi:hypothetical protein
MFRNLSVVFVFELMRLVAWEDFIMFSRLDVRFLASPDISRLRAQVFVVWISC